MLGRYCRVERADADVHGPGLFAALSEAPDPRNWTYLSAEPPASAEAYAVWLRSEAAKTDPSFQAVIELPGGGACGVAAFMRIDAPNGVIEIGHINFAPQLQRTRAATEAIFLMLRRVFGELGYRRCEWKCDSLNAPSRRAAVRYGFRFEGEFKQAVVYKGRSRDTAWFAMLDADWPAIRTRFERWLDPGNFDADGKQIKSLSDLSAG